MEFSYNLMGYEVQVNREPELVLIYGFAGLLLAILAITLLSYIFRKIGLQAVVSHLFLPLILSFELCLFITLLPTMILHFVIPSLSGVKLAYIWLTIFSGITIFTFINYNTIKKWGSDLSKLSRQKEFRNRRK